MPSFWTRSKAPGFSVQADPMMLYFLSKIDIRAKNLRRGSLDQFEIDILEEIRTHSETLQNVKPGTLIEDAAWTEAYALERMMALLEPSDTLLTELRHRVDQAATERVPAEPRLRAGLTMLEAQAVDESKDPPELFATQVSALRNLLIDALEEIHYTNQRKFYSRPIQKSATRKILIVALIALVIFLIPYAVIYSSPLFNDGFSVKNWGWLPLYTALISGLFGSCFSRLLYMQTNAELLSLGDLRNAREWTSILLRGSVGMCGALVVFFFLQSGMVGGTLFPPPEQLGLHLYSVSLDRPIGGPREPTTETAESRASAPETTTSEASPPPPPQTEKLSTPAAPPVEPDASAASQASLPKSPMPATPERPARPEATPLAGDAKSRADQALRLVLPSPSLALLVIWCFLAGFSERLVPNILSSTEDMLREAGKGSAK